MPTSYFIPASLQLTVLLIVLSFVAAETVWAYRSSRPPSNVKECVANLVMLAGFKLSRLLFLSWQLFSLQWFAQWAVVVFDSSLSVFILTFVVVDFLYYWEHRAMHEVEILWVFHEVHHSSPWLNLTTAFRLNWFTGLFAFVFFLPAVLIGLPINFIAAGISLNLLFQFFLHTEAIGKLGIFEGIINTPSAHRVHHGCNHLYVNRNYGGFLIIWDRLFGSYQAESVAPVYGVSSGFHGHNPLRLQWQGWLDYWHRHVNTHNTG